MISDFDSHSSAQSPSPSPSHSRRSSGRVASHVSFKDETDSIYTQAVLYPAVPPSQAFPWFTTVLDRLSEPLSRYHE